jgi:hypothetical protein
MSAALPFFVLSVIALALWIAPGGRVLLTVEDMGAVMQIEGIVLFGCVLVTLAVSVVKQRDLVVEAGDSPWPMLLMFVLATLMLGGFAYLVAGRQGLVAYALLQIVHLAGAFRLSGGELKIEYGLNFIGLFAFAALGFVAIKAPFLPDFGNRYPPVFTGGWEFHPKGHQMLAWACAHFALLGFLHLRKRRIWARFLEEKQ